MDKSRGLSLTSVLSCLALAILLGAAMAPAFDPTRSAVPAFLPEAQAIGKFLMPY